MHHNVQVGVLVHVALLVLSLVVSMAKGHNSSTDECLRTCDVYQRFLVGINKGWASASSQCRRRCLSTGHPLPGGVEKPSLESITSTTTTTTPDTVTTRLPTTTTTTTTTTPLPTTTTTTTTSSTTTSTPKTTTTTQSTTTSTPKTTTTTQSTTIPTTTTPTTVISSTTTSSTTLKCGTQREGIHKHRQRVIGGFPADRCEYPWMALVTAVNNVCGGAILDDHHIVTAAHCIKDRSTNLPYEASRVHVRAGSSTITLAKEYTVINVKPHPYHDTVNKVYDVAVLTVAEKIVFSECSRAICMPEMGSDPNDADVCINAGWGVTNLSSPSIQPELQEVELPIVSQENCQKSYGTDRINELTFCAGDFYNGGIDSCQGDSGGPLMCLVKGVFVIHGIVSSGSGCAVPRFPGIYTRIAHPNIWLFIKMAIGSSLPQLSSH